MTCRLALQVGNAGGKGPDDAVEAVEELRAENDLLRQVGYLRIASTAHGVLCRPHKLQMPAGSGGHAQQLE